MRLSEYRYRTLASLAGPLLVLRGIVGARIGEMVTIHGPDGTVLDGEVLEIDHDTALIEIYGETQGLDMVSTEVVFSDAIKLAPLSPQVLGRVFNGSFRPIDGLPLFIPEMSMPISGNAMNPSARASPEEFIETGLSVIDGLNTLVKGQKLPVFSCPGLPSKEVVAMILKNARLSTDSSVHTGGFVVVFAALGLTYHEYSFYMEVIEEMEADFVAIINMAEDPVMERLLAPRFALTVAEYLAFQQGMDVLTIVSDLTNYCDALREISTAREELPGRRGYPGYMYSDLASLLERAGRIRGMSGSVTLLPVLTMPEDDITHPIPDLTGYITEGQIVLSRELHQRGIFPPVDILPSLSRLMQRGIGAKHTREDHRKTANGLYRQYARGRDLRKLEAVVGRDGMTKHDQLMLDFADDVERTFVHQGIRRRTIAETLDAGLALLDRYSPGRAPDEATPEKS